jgi:carboxyl-terminal processing protease
MGGEFRQGIAEVKGTVDSGSTGGWMAKTRLILAGVGVVAAIAGFGLLFARKPLSPAERLAKLPAAQQNVIIFDAAVDLLKANYFDPALFQKPEWLAYETEWREKAAKSQSILLYTNVLSNFGAGFPDSHLNFQIAPSRVAPAAPSTIKPEQDPEAGDRFARNAALFFGSPGFDTATIRRSGRLVPVVAEVVRGSPADRAGVTPGWLVGKSEKAMDDSGVHFKATFFTITLAMTREVDRSGLPIVTTDQQALDELIAKHTAELTFDLEPLAPRTDFETLTLDGGVDYLRFDHFNDMKLIGRVLDAIDAAGPPGLVLDLRRNSGGRHLHMSRVAGRLLGGGVELGKTRTPGSSAPLQSLKLGDGHYEGPLVVLIGPASSSAAEIIAAAMQDHKRATLIGRATSGSVVMGKQYALPDGGTMMIPTADFLRPGDRRIEGVGVEPDIWIVPTLDDVRAGRDPVLERALVELRH